MEPPCEHGGVGSAAFGAVYETVTLQWSRRVNTAECNAMASGDDALDRLQWSRRVNTAECEIDGVQFKLNPLLQWSRRVNTAECGKDGTLGLSIDWASMEPPCEHGGVLGEDVYPRVIALGFNGAAV